MVKSCVKILRLALRLKKALAKLKGDYILSYGRDPQDTAKKYRVNKISESQFELQSLVEGLSKINLEYMGALLNFKVTPQYVRRHLSADEQPYYLIECLVIDLNIGFRGEEGWSSSLVDYRIFVIDEEVLKYAPLLHISILSEEQYNLQEIRNLLNMGKTPPENKSQHRPLAKLKLSYFENESTSQALGEIGGVIGLPKDSFEELLDGCLNKHIAEVCFHGVCSALSSSFKHGAARDLLLLSNQQLDIKIDSATLDYSCARLSR